jgi:ankyrin repeat protein
MRSACVSLLPLVILGACVAPPTDAFSRLAGPAREGDVATLQRLVLAGADPNVRDPAANHWTPLLHAIHKHQVAAVDVLLRLGADPTLAVNGQTPLLMAVGTGETAIVQRLLDAGVDPRADERIVLTAVAGGALSDLDNPLLGRCNTAVVKALVRRAPDLKVPDGARGRLALFFARLNNCPNGEAIRSR